MEREISILDYSCMYENCNGTQSLDTKLHKLLHSVPLEILDLILEKSTRYRPCIKHVLGKCFDPWNCRMGDHDIRGLLPPKGFENICSGMYDRAVEQFFFNSTLVFSEGGLDFLHDHTIEGQSRLDEELFFSNLVAPEKLYIFDFLDGPEWKELGSSFFRKLHSEKTHEILNANRHRIRHIIIKLRDSNLLSPYPHSQWRWPLLIDWRTLPRLKTLVIDLRSYSFGGSDQITTDTLLRRAAQILGHLKLQSLTLIGLCSGSFYGNKGHEQHMRSLFRGAMASSGEMKFEDESSQGLW